MNTTTKHIVIVGAGPGGLLMAINLLRHNVVGATPKYTVELVEGGEDYGLLDDAGLTKKRSWMIGLAWPGLRAIRRVPKLFDDYVGQIGVEINKVAIYLGAKKLISSSGDAGSDSENYLVDRNLVCAALARYLNAHYGDSPCFTRRYGTRLMFVDGDERRIFVRASDGSETYLPYDLLVGADGVRSGVRAALVAHHRDFECTVADIFERFKSVHIDMPDGVEPHCMHALPSIVKNMNGIGLVETGNRINISMGHRCHAPCDDEMRSNDPTVVADYLRSNFKAFPLPYDEFAKAWCGQGWSSTTKTYCNFYHSTKLQLVILGDAAHATSPSIGMGMNHALGDAACLDELLSECDGDLDKVLPEYSKRRVKEGQALTDVADLIQSYDGAQNLLITLRQALRGVGHSLLPSLVAPEPYLAIGNGLPLSKAYAELTRTGRIQAVRRTNDAVKRAHFEKMTGMVPPPPSSSSLAKTLKVAIVAIVLAGLAAAGLRGGGGTAGAATPAAIVTEASAAGARPWWAGGLFIKGKASLV